MITTMRRHPAILVGLLTGAALARLEIGLLGLSFLTPVLFGAGFVAGWRWPAPRWTLCGVVIGMASPVLLLHMTVLAMAIAGIGWLAWAERRFELKRSWSVGLLAGVFFVAALSSGVLPGDAGEFQVVAATWGVAHPPGYSLYTLLAGGLAHALPLGGIAWRINLLSALVGALAVGWLAAAVGRETGRAWVGRLTGLILAASATFWMVSTQASIRPLSVFFVVAMIEAMLAYRRALRENRSPTPALIRFGLAAGFGVTHHGSLLFLGMVLAVAIAAVDVRAWRRWPVAVLAALPGALPLLYFPIRHSGFLAPAGLDTWDGFWNHVLARGFAGDALGNLGPESWPQHWQVAREMFALQWPVWLLALAVLGLLLALWRDRWLGITLIAGLIVHTAVSITYPASPMSEYMLPVYVLLAVAAGWLVGTVQGWRSILLGGVALAAVAFGITANWQTTERLYYHEDQNRDRLADLLQSAPDQALVLSPWHFATPLWYLQQVEAMRPDVEVRYVAPHGAETPMDTWTHQIEDAVGAGQTVLALQQFPEAYRFLPFTFAGSRVLITPLPTPETDAVIAFGPHGLAQDWSVDGVLRAGETARVQLTWYLGEPVPYGALTTFVHLGLDDQPPVAQIDLPVQAPGGAGALDLTYDLVIPSTVPPGEWGIFAGAYTPSGVIGGPDGQARVRLGTVRVEPGRYPVPTQHVVWKNVGPARLLGWDYDTTLPDQSVLYLHWQLRETDRQYDVALEDTAGGRWAAVSAGVGAQAGYWTSMHLIPDSIAGKPVRVYVGNASVLIPAVGAGAHYIPFGNLAALVDWHTDTSGRELKTSVTWLPFGAADTDVKLHFEITGAGWMETADFVPVRGQLPAYRWEFGRTVRSQQTITLAHDDPPQSISILLYDGYSGLRYPVQSSYLSDDYSGVKIGP